MPPMYFRLQEIARINGCSSLCFVILFTILHTCIYKKPTHNYIVAAFYNMQLLDS